MDANRSIPRHLLIIIKRPKVNDEEKDSYKQQEEEVSYQMIARWEEGGREWVKR